MSSSSRTRAARRGPAFLSWRATSWRDAVSLAEHMHGWLFRGQASAQWRLKTSLERTAETFHCPQNALPAQEEEIINQFKRQAHQYLQYVPDEEDNLEWLALIQHHSGPTRLLDFTGSFYIGAFFAIEAAEKDAVVWAVNRSLLDYDFLERADLLPEGGHKPTLANAKRETAERCIGGSFGGSHLRDDPPEEEPPDPILNKPYVLAVKPWRLNQRMIIQQGWFLFPTSLDTTFEHNLCSALGVPGDTLPENAEVASVDDLRSHIKGDNSNLSMIRMTFPRETHLDAVRDLYRMNVTAATLFPGLDGFARSLHYSLRIFDDFGLP